LARFIIRRLIQMVGVVFVLSLLLFLWLRSLPGGPVSAILGERATDESRAALEKAFGLDQPVYVQYLKFLQRASQGDFGASTAVLPGRDALEIFFTRLPATIELSIIAMAIAIVLAIPLGYVAAKRHGSSIDNGAVVLSLIGVAVPVFFLAFLLKYWFAIKTGTFPVSGRQDAALGCTRVTNFFVLDGLLTREFDCSADALQATSCSPRSLSRPSRSPSSSGSPARPCSTSSTRTTCAPRRPRA
jgi:peptide/nickel transport system permease protein